MRTAVVFCSVLAALILDGAVSADSPARYYVRQLPSLGDFAYDTAYAMNGAGDIAGRSGTNIVVWNVEGGAAKSRYEMPEGRVVDVMGLNASGVMAGKIVDTDTAAITAVVIDTKGSLKEVGRLGRGPAEALEINDSGSVVGFAYNNEGNSRAFIWKPDTGLKELPLSENTIRSGACDINSVGQIAGYCGVFAVMWEADGSVTKLPIPDNHNRCVAYGLNDKGLVVGEAVDAANKMHAFLWNPKTGAVAMESLPGYDESRAEDVNDSGCIVGWLRNSRKETRAVIWNTEGEITDLGQLTKELYSQGFAVNSAGYVVGTTRTIDGKTHAVVWSPLKQE